MVHLQYERLAAAVDDHVEAQELETRARVALPDTHRVRRLVPVTHFGQPAEDREDDGALNAVPDNVEDAVAVVIAIITLLPVSPLACWPPFLFSRGF